jgi:hypothetical protein
MVFTLINSKPAKSSSSSSYIFSKKSFAVTKNDAENQSIIVSNNCPNNKGISNIGGPGDKIPAKNDKCCTIKGNKGRVTDNGSGVDKKHGSYERYLARKTGWVLRNQYC